jgi:hypothetical protein
MNPEIHYQSIQQALSLVESGHHLFIHGSACTPVFLMQHLAQRKDELQNVELVFISLYGTLLLIALSLQTAFTSIPCSSVTP